MPVAGNGRQVAATVISLWAGLVKDYFAAMVCSGENCSGFRLRVGPFLSEDFGPAGLRGELRTLARVRH